MKKEPVRYIPDLEQCLRCAHGVRSFSRQRLPDTDPDNEHCNNLPFAFMPTVNNEGDVTCTLFEEKDDDTW